MRAAAARWAGVLTLAVDDRADAFFLAAAFLLGAFLAEALLTDVFFKGAFLAGAFFEGVFFAAAFVVVRVSDSPRVAFFRLSKLSSRHSR